MIIAIKPILTKRFAVVFFINAINPIMIPRPACREPAVSPPNGSPIKITNDIHVSLQKLNIKAIHHTGLDRPQINANNAQPSARFTGGCSGDSEVGVGVSVGFSAMVAPFKRFQLKNSEDTILNYCLFSRDHVSVDVTIFTSPPNDRSCSRWSDLIVALMWAIESW